jgi:hypothetical protein
VTCLAKASPAPPIFVTPALTSGRRVKGRRNADRMRRAKRALDVVTATRTIGR